MIHCEKIKKSISCLNHLYEIETNFLAKYIAPLLLLALRLMIASVFLKSGLTKISNFDSTLFLFENEYNVPILSPIMAACLATFCELVLSVLLIVGLASRLAALPLMVMTLVIQFSVIQNPMHFYWLALLAVIVTFGPGCISLDALIRRCALNCSSKQ